MPDQRSGLSADRAPLIAPRDQSAMAARRAARASQAGAARLFHLGSAPRNGGSDMLDEYRLMNAREVCRLAAISLPTLYRYVRKGQFPGPLAIGSQARRWRSDEVLAHLENLTAERDARAAA